MRARRVGGALAIVLLVAGCTGSRPIFGQPPQSAAASRDFRPGAVGIGDTYFPHYGNGGYDVASYDLKIKYDPQTDRLTGHATITATAAADLSQFNLDFAGPDITKLSVNGVDAKYERQDDELVVTPATGLVESGQFTVDVAYDGVPKAITRPGLGPEGFLHTDDGALAIGQPESASAWYPVNDHPQDKATYAVAITVPEKLTALSNGVPKGTTVDAGWATWTWAEGEPMASYLSTVVIGRYRVKTGTHAGKPVVTAVDESIPLGAADRALARTAEIADFLATQFGPYPFDAYGGIVQNDSRIRFALENQTRPVYAAQFFFGGDPTWVLAHELAHQWYGDSVSIQQWKDIWLNEGFATYAEWLWSEHEGHGTPAQLFEKAYTSANDDVWRTPPGDPGPAKLFSRSVYQRGAMTLHALRETVGDDAFFRILKTWAAEKRNGNGATAEFITLAERVSGKALRSLFDAWLFKPEQPKRP